MSTQIEGTSLETLFDLIRKIYSRHGANLFTPWQSWSTLNQYYPCHLLGNHIKTDEHNRFDKFASQYGSHPVLGSRVSGDDDSAFEELAQVLGLELVEDRDGASFLTYPGKRDRYWKITNPEFAGDEFGKAGDISESEQLANVVALMQEMVVEDA